MAISGAVLTGALIVGDSVEYSLNRIVDHRLGGVTHVMTAGDRYFTSELSSEGQGSASGTGVFRASSGRNCSGRRGTKRINHIQVLGVMIRFDRMAGTG